jgi:hypothetical protein
MTLTQRLALWKYLTARLAALHEDLKPQATAEMPSGSRIPVMFGGNHAGWVSMPKPAQRAAYVSSEKDLLAWAEKHYPGHVETTETAVVTAEVLDVLREHLPGAIVPGRRVNPDWVADLTSALRDPGYYITSAGERLTGVPGITLPDPVPPVPHVDLTSNAEQIIGAARQAGGIPFGDLLALPAPEDGAA